MRGGAPEGLSAGPHRPAAIQKVNEALWGFGLKFTEEKIKKPGGGFGKIKFTVPSRVTCDITITADHDNARLVLKGKHFFRLGPDELRIPAGDTDEPLL